MFEGKELYNHQNLEFYKITNDSQLTLISNKIHKIQKKYSSAKITIFVKTLTGKVISISCTRNCSIEDFKELIEDIEGIPPD